MDRKKQLDEKELEQVNGGTEPGEYSTGSDVSGKGPAGAKKKSIRQYGITDDPISDDLFR